MRSPSLVPAFEKISTLTATILLSYTLARFVELPERLYRFEGAGFIFEFNLNVNTLVSLLVAGICASGADWLLRSHPSLQNRSTIQHWVLPGLTAMVLGILLNRLAFNTLWWVILGLGGMIIAIVLVFEYVVVDAKDPLYPIATAGLTAVAFAIFLVLISSLRAAGTRLLTAMPIFAIAGGLLCSRSLYLRLLPTHEVDQDTQMMIFYTSLVTTLIVGQVATALHYYPILPVSYALVILSFSYSLLVYFGNLALGKGGSAILEPVMIAVSFLLLANWIHM